MAAGVRPDRAVHDVGAVDRRDGIADSTEGDEQRKERDRLKALVEGREWAAVSTAGSGPEVAAMVAIPTE